MSGILDRTISRRALLAGGAATGTLLLLPGCAGGDVELGGLGGGVAGRGSAFGPADVLRRLLGLSSQNAFARLTVPGLFWRQQMAELDLAKMTGNGRNTLSRMLESGPFKGELEQIFARLAADASSRVAPLVNFRARNIATSNATALLRRRSGGASRFLRQTMGDALLDVIVPELNKSLSAPSDSLLGQVIVARNGVDIGELARDLGRAIEDAIWEAIADEERAIRVDPAVTRDLLLIRAFGAS
jgi:hypothetical protein